MNEIRDFKGVWIKKEIWLNTNLTLIEKVLIVEIDSLDNSERGCFASNEYLAKFVNLIPALRLLVIIFPLISGSQIGP